MKITILQGGEVFLSPGFCFGGDKKGSNPLAGLLTKQENRLVFPINAYLIETGRHRVLVDTGLPRACASAQTLGVLEGMKFFGMHYVNQPCHLRPGQGVADRLSALHVDPSSIDCIVLTHLDFDNVGGLEDLPGARRVLVSREEAMEGVRDSLRYQRKWWKDQHVNVFDWKETEGPFGRSLDLFGDGVIRLIELSGHSAGMCGVKIKNERGKFVLLYADAGYGEQAWKELTLPSLYRFKDRAKTALEWVRMESMHKNCVVSMGCHETQVQPDVITW